MIRKKSAKTQRIKEIDPRLGNGLIRLGLILTGVTLVVSSVWVLYPLLNKKANSSSRGPRLQADAIEISDSTTGQPFQLPTSPEPIEMAQLQEEMISQAKHLEAFYAKDSTALDICASVYYDLNQLDEADRLWKACVALQPTEHDPYIRYAQFLTAQERAEEAIKLIELAHSKSIETAGTYHQLAVAYDRSGQAEKAFEIAEEITHRFPDYGDSWLLKGKVQNQLGKTVDAETSLQKALELGQTEIDVWPVLVTVLARKGDRQQAAELRAKLKTLQDSAKATDAQGELQPFQQKFEASLRDRAARLFYLSAVQEKKNWNTNESLRLATRSIQIKPNDPPALVYLAEQLVEANRVADAIVVYQRLIDIQPENIVNFTNLAGLAFREKNQLLAARTLESGLKFHPDEVILQIPLAKVYVGLRRPLEAREIVSKILTTQNNPEAMMILGASYQLTGELDEANKAFERAKAISALPIQK